MKNFGRFRSICVWIRTRKPKKDSKIASKLGTIPIQFYLFLEGFYVETGAIHLPEKVFPEKLKKKKNCKINKSFDTHSIYNT